MSSYITIDGRDYWSPCSECKDGYCSSCLLRKYREDFEKEKDKRTSAEFRIENELEPRIKAEQRSYDFYITTDRSAEWCDAFDCRVNELIDMFDEDFDFSAFDFSGDDIVSKVATLIYESKMKGGEGWRKFGGVGGFVMGWGWFRDEYIYSQATEKDIDMALNEIKGGANG